MNATILSQLEPLMVWLLLALAVLNILALLWLLLRRADKQATEATNNSKAEVLGAVTSSTERLERELRREITESSRGGRQELTQSFGAFQQAVVTQSGEAFRTQNTQIDAFTAQSSQQLATVTQQIVGLQKSIADTLNTQLQGLSDANARRLSEVRETLKSNCCNCKAPMPPNWTRCGKQWMKNCKVPCKPAWVKVSSKSPIAWSRCTKAWVKCKP